MKDVALIYDICVSISLYITLIFCMSYKARDEKVLFICKMRIFINGVNEVLFQKLDLYYNH